jgi:hypothetical protein
MVGGKKFPYTKAGKAAAAKAAGKKASGLVEPRPPKPPREDVYGKPDRDFFDVYPAPKPKLKTERRPVPKPKPERRPVDERGVFRRRG